MICCSISFIIFYYLYGFVTEYKLQKMDFFHFVWSDVLKIFYFRSPLQWKIALKLSVYAQKESIPTKPCWGNHASAPTEEDHPFIPFSRKFIHKPNSHRMKRGCCRVACWHHQLSGTASVSQVWQGRVYPELSPPNAARYIRGIYSIKVQSIQRCYGNGQDIILPRKDKAI